jgi:hypothetical protein
MTDNPSSVTAPSTFGFINDDVKKQIAVSRSILDVAEKLREKLADTADEDEKAALAEEIRKLVKLANDLSANAMFTSTTASAAISAVIITPIKT